MKKTKTKNLESLQFIYTIANLLQFYFTDQSSGISREIIPVLYPSKLVSFIPYRNNQHGRVLYELK